MVGRKDKGKKHDHRTHINLKVTSQVGKEMSFRIKHNTQLRKLMEAYCDDKSMDFQSIVFLFEGRRLRGNETPDELEMDDGDEIDAMLHQHGGCFALPCRCLIELVSSFNMDISIAKEHIANA